MKSISSGVAVSMPMSFPARGTWIEIRSASYNFGCIVSFPARGTWIEIFLRFPPAGVIWVVPREGNVD